MRWIILQFIKSDFTKSVWVPPNKKYCSRKSSLTVDGYLNYDAKGYLNLMETERF